jgi:hypothetical protein
MPALCRTELIPFFSVERNLFRYMVFFRHEDTPPLRQVSEHREERSSSRPPNITHPSRCSSSRGNKSNVSSTCRMRIFRGLLKSIAVAVALPIEGQPDDCVAFSAKVVIPAIFPRMEERHELSALRILALDAVRLQRQHRVRGVGRRR